MIFIGIDLAWSERNPSGGAVIIDNHLVVATGTLGNDDEIIAFVERHLPPLAGAVIAIDAPLRVPNLTGARPCDRALSADWRRYEAGALPANRRLLAYQSSVQIQEGDKTSHPSIRGESLVERFQELGFQEAAPLPQQREGRYLCEIFPHPAHVSFFHLGTTLKYKAKPGRTRQLRHNEFIRYRDYLFGLQAATPPLHDLAFVLVEDVASLRGKSLKAYEDKLDAITCAYTASYLWLHGPTQCEVYGSVEEGHILTPRLPHRSPDSNRI